MPNVITNYSVFRGPNAALQWIRASNMNFQKILPCPYIPADGSRPPNDDWYDWCCAEWGTKWSAWDPDFEIIWGEVDCLRVRYKTAWNPAHGLLSYLTQRFPGLRIENRYVEEFQQRYGFTVYEGGVITDRHILPDQFSGEALRAFAATAPWFDYDGYAYFLALMGGSLDGGENKEPVVPVETHVTRDEFIEKFR
jgi:hypothetical protein